MTIQTEHWRDRTIQKRLAVGRQDPVRNFEAVCLFSLLGLVLTAVILALGGPDVIAAFNLGAILGGG